MTANPWGAVRAVVVSMAGDGDVSGDRETAPDEGDRPDGGSPAGGSNDTNGLEFRFLTGSLRWGVDHAPGIVIAVTIVLFGTAELAPGGVEGVSALFVEYQLVRPLASLSTATFLVLAVCWSAILLGIFVYAGHIRVRDLLVGIVGYGVVAALVAGTVLSVVLVLTSENPTTLPPNVVFTSGYLLMLLIAGSYISKSMAFTERLMVQLPDKLYDPGRAEESHHPSAADASGGGPEDVDSRSRNERSTYGQFIDDLEGSLRAGGDRIQLAHVFAFLIILPPAYVWWSGSGPQNLGAPTSSLTALLVYGTNLAFDFVIAVVAFKFLVLVKYVHELTSGSYPAETDDNLQLLYDLRHPDDCAGLYDLGDFAMRVNVLLLIALVYLVYRLYVQGLRALPPDVFVDLSLEGVSYNWIVGYVGPVFIFTVVAGAWLYFSFWQIHQKMVRDRRHLLERWPKGVGDDHEHIRPDNPDLEDIREAPVWPIDNKQLIPLALANAVPALVVLIEGLG